MLPGSVPTLEHWNERWRGVNNYDYFVSDIYAYAIIPKMR
jgi:hypothetical protein